MKTLIATIEKNEDAYFAYINEIEGCVAGGENFEEVKLNLDEILQICIDEDEELQTKYSKGYKTKFEVDLKSLFDLLPEINITQLAKLGGLNSGLLRQYVSGSKKASERQAMKVMLAIEKLALKLNAIRVSA
jgi:predicted RNase H-like HicB family nuclease